MTDVPTAGDRQPPQTWLWQSIVATLLCCLPAGVVGIIYAAQANSAVSAGNYAEAEAKARTAKTWTLVSVGLAVVGIILGIIFVVVAGFSLPTDSGETSTDDLSVAADTGAEENLPDEPQAAEGNLADDVVVETDGEVPTDAVTGTSAEPCGPAPEGAPTADTSLSYDAPPEPDYASGTVTVTMETTCGTIVMALDADAAPQTVSSFAFLADEGFYTGVPFHRVKDQFVIQGGDPTGTGTGGPGYTFADELALAEAVVAENGVYPRGTLAMANSGPDTNGSQFFVVQAEAGYSFPPNYAVFGEVVEGMDVVDRIAQGPVDGPQADRAVDPVRIVSVTAS